MKTLLALMLMFPALVMAGPHNDWTETGKLLRDYLADGYTVVGFQITPIETRVMPLTAYRYLLQKGTSLVLCSEKLSDSSSPMSTACYQLN